MIVNLFFQFLQYLVGFYRIFGFLFIFFEMCFNCFSARWSHVMHLPNHISQCIISVKYDVIKLKNVEQCIVYGVQYTRIPSWENWTLKICGHEKLSIKIKDFFFKKRKKKWKRIYVVRIIWKLIVLCITSPYTIGSVHFFKPFFLLK